MQKTAAKSHKGKKDLHGNPEGTIYNEAGIAEHEAYEGLTNLPLAEDGKPAIMYNEDGSVFTPDEKAAEKVAAMKLKVSELASAVSKGKERLAHAQAMMDEADEADKPIYGKAVNSQQVAIDSNQKAMEAAQGELDAFRMSQITPAQRKDAAELAKLKLELAVITARIKELEAKAKIHTVDLPKAAGAKSDASEHVSTEEQKVNHAAAVAQYGSQGKAIVAMVKEGKNNTEIYKHLGIPPASVPGPKNAFLQSAEGQKYEVVEGRARLKA